MEASRRQVMLLLGCHGAAMVSAGELSSPQTSRALVSKPSAGAAATTAAVALPTDLAAAPEPMLLNLDELPTESDGRGRERLRLQLDGYLTWTWRGYRINYVACGDDSASSAVLLVHGFGASVYHWRYNIPELARRGLRVFAVDLLGLGWSAKPSIEYSSQLWQQQLADFMREVVRMPAVLVGNSVGGYAVLNATLSCPDLVSGLVLINVAGQFDPSPSDPSVPPPLMDAEEEGEESLSLWVRVRAAMAALVERVALYFAFLQLKQPERIRSVLTRVYPVDASNVDEDLVRSIVLPSNDSNAADVYYRLSSRLLLRKGSLALNIILQQLAAMERPLQQTPAISPPPGEAATKEGEDGVQEEKEEEMHVNALSEASAPAAAAAAAAAAPSSVPMLLLWGDKDPWMTPAKAVKIMDLYPLAQKISLNAGHCPHDEAPDAVNLELLRWIRSL